MTQQMIADSVRRHSERNAELRVLLEERGVDLSEPRPIEFHFHAGSQRDAAVLGRALFEMGFLVQLLAPAPTEDDPDYWVVEAGAQVAPARALGDELTTRLVKLASKNDADFDGWGTSVERGC